MVTATKRTLSGLVLAAIVLFGAAVPAYSSDESIVVSIGGSPYASSVNAVTISLNGFSSGNYQATVKLVDADGLDASNGTFAQTHTTGLTAIAGYSLSSGAKIGFSGTLANIEAALGTVTWTPTSTGSGNRLQVAVASAPGANQFYSSSTDRYYEYVSGEVNWSSAKTGAAAKTLFGLDGYLAHVTSAAENEFIANETSATNIWIGATDADTEGDWKWDGAVVTGDQTSLGSYVFFRDPSTSATGYSDWDLTVTGNAAITFDHAAWHDDEPNDYSTGEDCAVTNWGGDKGEWNDLPCTRTSGIDGYLVEYGGLSGTSTAVSTSVTETFTVAAAVSPTVTATIHGTPRVGSEGAVSVLLGGFTNGTYQATIKIVDSGGLDDPNGTFAHDHSSGLSSISGYSLSSGAKIGFSGSLANIRSAFDSLTWTPATAASNVILQVSVASAPGANQFYSSSTGRYYEYVSTTTNWASAKTAAAAKTLFGMDGYLAHITTAAENEFIANETSASNIWIGATDAATEGDWKWDGAVVTGDQTSLGGYVFSRFPVTSGHSTSTTPSASATGYTDWDLTVTGSSQVTISYAGWASTQPDDHQHDSNGENCAVTNWSGSKGRWNDLRCTETWGYLVEYGGLSGTSTAVSVSTTETTTVGAAVGAVAVSEIWTDFDGYWNSSTTDAAVGVASYAPDFPDESHDLLGFTWDGTTYSTGVDDAILTSNSVTFTADVWSALPIDEVAYTFACSSAASNTFVVAVGATQSAPSKAGSCYSAEENASLLTSGTQGLNLGQALVNVPSASTLDFAVTSITDGEIDDDVPDILFTQIAAASTNAGQTISLHDAHGRLVGNEVSFSGTAISNISSTGFWDTSIFRMSGAAWSGVSGKKPMRIFALELDDLGISSSNADDVATVRWQPTGTDSDIAFLGYNTTALSVEDVATLPGQPTGLTATASGPTTADSSVAVEVALSWTAPTSDGGAPLTDYKIEYRVGSGSWQTFTRAASVSTSATVTGLTGLEDVQFRVSADNSPYSGPGVTGVGTPSSVVSIGDWVCADLDEFDSLGEIAELDLWLRADCLTGTPTSLSDGSAFSTWSDLSGEDNDATTLTGKLDPTLQSDSDSLINGLPAAHFSRTSGAAGNTSGGTVLNVAGVDLRKTTNPDVTVFVVYEPERSVTDASDTAESHGVWGIDNGGWDRFYISDYQGSGWGDDGLISLGPTQSVATHGGINTITDGGEHGTPRLLTVVYDGEQTSGGTPPSNGSAVYFRDTLVTSFTDSTAWSAAQTSLSIGWDGDNNPFRGKIAEFIVFNDALDSSLPTIQNYLRDRYDLARTPVDGEVPDVLVVDPRAQDLNFPALTLTDSNEAMVCFSQVADSSGTALSGSPTITVGRTSTTAGVTENTAANSWRYSGPRASVQTQTSSIQISGTGSNAVVSTGSKWLRVNITADPTDQAACTASDVEVDEIVELRSVSLATRLNLNLSF